MCDHGFVSIDSSVNQEESCSLHIQELIKYKTTLSLAKSKHI